MHIHQALLLEIQPEGQVKAVTVASCRELKGETRFCFTLELTCSW